MTEVRSTLGIAEVRHTIRAPLHRLMSSAESVLERRAAIQNENLTSALLKVLSHCQSIFTMVGSVSDPKQNEISYEGIAPQLEDAGVQLVRFAEELPTQGIAADVSADIVKICATAKDFLRQIRKKNQEISAKNKSSNAVPCSEDADSHDAAPPVRGLILVVDDDQGNRDVLSRRLLRDGREVMLAEGGRHAMRMLQRYPFDLVLLDIMMPDMDGYEVLAEMKRDPKLRHLPVIMITAADDTESVVRCVEMGADDYLLKPFNRILLNARINVLLERKRLYDQDAQKADEMKRLLSEIEEQRCRSHNLLQNILPETIATELQNTGCVQPMYFEDVTIVFADIVGFALSTEEIPADELVYILHEYFTAFDRIMGLYGLEKLKTIGDCYMFAGGLPVRSSSNPIDCVLAASDMIDAVKKLEETCQVGWRLRIGINTGPVIAGVVGIRKFAFDIWGHTVNFAARIESAGQPNQVNLSAATYSRVRDFFDCRKQEQVRLKEGREVDTYLVTGVSARLIAKNPGLLPQEAFAQRYSRYFRKPLSAFPNCFNAQSAKANESI